MMRSVVPVECRKEGAKRSRWHGLVYAFVLFASVWTLCGCTQPGETMAETNRRHRRVLEVNNETMLKDLDEVLMWDRPSHLTDERVP
jgi:hypothetical protein